MIVVEKVFKKYEQFLALEDVSLTIQQGEIFGIVGHSGAGKSTLLRTFNRLEVIDSGKITIDGKNITLLDKNELRLFRRQVGMIFQHFSLLETQNVFSNIALPLINSKMSKEEIKNRVEELAKIVGLQDKLKSRPKELSGGQKQRVSIARALANNPKILLCDEATSALDPTTSKSILKLLKEINEKYQITIVIVTHQMEVVKEICSRIAIMESGQVKEIGKTEDLFLDKNSILKTLIKEDEIVPKTGKNIRIYFAKESSNDSLITGMARELDLDFSIVWGKLERFIDDVLGSLIINIKEEQDVKRVIQYLEKHHYPYEEVNYE